MKSFAAVMGGLCLGWLTGCSGDGGAAVDTGGSGASDSGSPPATQTSATSADGGSGPGDGGGGSGSTGAGATGSVDTSAGGTAGDTNGTGSNPPPPPPPIACNGVLLECGNGLDDDGDGHIDLYDPECTGPCDDDESSLATGLPGDNSDCKQDCFFDGNSGQGDDGCEWNIKCDPSNPGANINCPYTGGQNCDAMATPTQMCLDFCQQYVPPGCDCYGCCTVQTPSGDMNIFLDSGPDCSLSNLDACQPCMLQIDVCGTTCDPDVCFPCFGQTELPPGCDQIECPSTMTCDSDHPEDCPAGYYCDSSACCLPLPGG